MDKSTPLTLIKNTFTTDAIGQMIPIESTSVVYANIKSVSRAEFFEGGAAGLKPSFVATMFAPDYNDEEQCEFALFGKSPVRYSIYRTYLGNDETIELYLEKRVGNG